MSKLVLLALNAKYVHSSLPVWVLAGGVFQYARLPHDVAVVEATIHQSNEDIAGQVMAHRPDVVGISTYIWNAGKLPGLLRLLRERLPDTDFVLGGPEASYNAAYWLGHGADYVLRGEGEQSLPALLDALAEGRPAPTGQIPPREPVDPYGEDCMRSLNGRIAYLETSRGCPFRCAFCLSGGSGVRFFPLDMAKEQISKLSRSGARTVKLVDRTFNCDAGRAYALFAYIIGLDTDCCFHFEVAADLFDEQTLALLQTAPPGRIQLEAGLQSYYEPALQAVSRQTDIIKAERNMQTLLQGQNIHIHLDLIAGLPYETLPELQNSFDRAFTLGAHTLQLGFLKLLHGSALREQAETLGIIYAAEPPYEISSSPWLRAEDLTVIKQTENGLRQTYNKSRFLSVLRYVLSVSGLRPFALFHTIGEAAPNHGTALEDYARQLYDCLRKLPGVDDDELREKMICDWLGMVKGKNMPSFLRPPGTLCRQAADIAQKQLGRGIGRGEAAVLPSGRAVYADSSARDPVTGLYKVYIKNNV